MISQPNEKQQLNFTILQGRQLPWLMIMLEFKYSHYNDAGTMAEIMPLHWQAFLGNNLVLFGSSYNFALVVTSWVIQYTSLPLLCQRSSPVSTV